MLTFRLYRSSDKADWDEFVKTSKNATFLHLRDYMDYHADRFSDFSLMVFRDNHLYALLPACRIGREIVSHAGLTFGGLLMNSKATASDILSLFEALRIYLHEAGFRRLIYSPSPHIYHSLPAEEDLYAIFRCGAALSSRKISSVVIPSNLLRWRNIRKAGVKKAVRAGLYLEETDDYSHFWIILENNLAERYSTSPVHSLEEIKSLHSHFPEHIRLHVVKKNGSVVAGVVLYISSQVAHCQYISANKEGKESGALDLLFHHLLTERYKDFRCFDFGTSNEQAGLYLNESLIYQKEGFGARGICYDTYSIPL